MIQVYLHIKQNKDKSVPKAFFFPLTSSIYFLPEVKQSRSFSYSSAFKIDEKEINSILPVHTQEATNSLAIKRLIGCLTVIYSQLFLSPNILD